MKLSIYQENVRSFIRKQQGSAVISAVAGSGKTTTLVNVAAPEIAGKACFLAFSKAIQQELEKKLPKTIDCKTLHALGFAAIRAKSKRVKVESRKYQDILKNVIEDFENSNYRFEDDDYGTILESGKKILELGRANVIDFSKMQEIFDLAFYYDIDLPSSEVCSDFCEIINLTIDQGLKDLSCIDFGDMVYMPVVFRDLAIEQYDWLLVDECQDLNKAQRMLCQKALKRGGRAIFVGDRNQAIFGFAGAQVDSVDQIIKDFDCQEIPLSICYRCPSSHIDLCKEIVPQMEARPDAPKGEILEISSDAIFEHLREGDMVVCRKNSPLVSLCFKLLAKKIPARIKGRDIGQGLIFLAKKLSKGKNFSWGSFPGKVQEWKEKESQKLRIMMASDSAIESVRDKAESLFVLYSVDLPTSMREFEQTVNSIFSDDRASVQLSSVHRAKGLEANNVFIFDPSLLPAPWAAVGTWQYQQEKNLEYVAKSRAKEKLVFVG